MCFLVHFNGEKGMKNKTKNVWANQKAVHARIKSIRMDMYTLDGVSNSKTGGEEVRTRNTQNDNN